MPSFEINKLQAVAPVRTPSDADRTANGVSGARPVAGSSTSAPANARGVEIELSNAVDAASPPVDRDRVSEIREALRDGRYPLVPTEIADAMIAAQLSFGIQQ